jgi:hypothetical protein
LDVAGPAHTLASALGLALGVLAVLGIVVSARSTSDDSSDGANLAFFPQPKPAADAPRAPSQGEIVSARRSLERLASLDPSRR